MIFECSFQVQCQFMSSTICLTSSHIHVCVSSEGVSISNQIVVPVARTSHIHNVEPPLLSLNSTVSIFGSGFISDMFAVV